MNLVASVSRSSGLEKGGDDLKDNAVQEEYREFIRDKIDSAPEVWDTQNLPALPKEELERRDEVRENILILLRKLREGISAAKRSDAFAIEVYETSFFLAVVSRSHRRISPIVSQVHPELYADTPGPHSNADVAFLVSLIYHLAASYPLQTPFQQQLSIVTGQLLPPASPQHKWIKSIAASLRQSNYTRFYQLTTTSALPLSDDLSLDALSLRPQSSRASAEKALSVALDMLQAKVRERAWEILRMAYHELSTAPEGATWLARSLALEPDPETVTRWLDGQSEKGGVKRKENGGERWLTCKN